MPRRSPISGRSYRLRNQAHNETTSLAADDAVSSKPAFRPPGSTPSSKPLDAGLDIYETNAFRPVDTKPVIDSNALAPPTAIFRPSCSIRGRASPAASLGGDD